MEKENLKYTKLLKRIMKEESTQKYQRLNLKGNGF
ncbi:hypothetical protein HNQ54_004493 [Anaerocolumna cellulosilytica]|nr:hypothetical protein [Anaerocolumna cellulosilytica]